MNAAGRGDGDQRAAKSGLLRSRSLARKPLLRAPQLGLGSGEREDRVDADAAFYAVRVCRVERDLETANRALKVGASASYVLWRATVNGTARRTRERLDYAELPRNGRPKLPPLAVLLVLLDQGELLAQGDLLRGRKTG
jgi:hypothetical protein